MDLFNRKICNEIFDANLSTMVISADHYEKKQFEELRKIQNLKKLLKM